jgi:hypothetical protein
MSRIDSELTLLRAKIAQLEEQKQEEKLVEDYIKAYPLESLEKIIEKKKKDIERNSDRSLSVQRTQDEEKVAFLEPILYALQNITKRLEVLESK